MAPLSWYEPRPSMSMVTATWMVEMTEARWAVMTLGGLASQDNYCSGSGWHWTARAMRLSTSCWC